MALQLYFNSINSKKNPASFETLAGYDLII